MPNTLSKQQRSLLAQVTLAARDAAEGAARAALENRAVHEKDFRPHMSLEVRKLRNRLRAHGRALGDRYDDRSGTQSVDHLVEAVAYEHWHRLLFTRFLAENGLLHTDGANGSVPVTLAECEELAPELGARDGFELACRFASHTLPGVFRTDDPVLELRLAPNDEVELRKLVHSLPAELFRADDALGWTYQFWQAKRKDEVNKSGKKIGAEELPAVTQLFTEDYMVEFLLHNTIGAWWAGKSGPIVAASEEEARQKVSLSARNGLPEIEWTYLRLIRDGATNIWRPAAGAFDGWPRTAKEIRFLDPCMGSGHFPVFALRILARLRVEEERLTSAEAVAATLRDNIYGLEIDPRCTQIGAFNLALTAWKVGGWQPLPPLHVACSGLAPHAAEKDWVALAGDSDRLKRGMARLYRLFKDAPVLGSLINPSVAAGDLVESGIQELQPLLEKALAEEAGDAAAHEMGVTASGLAKASAILGGRFTLVATNVPYLSNRKQCAELKDFCTEQYRNAKNDLAVTFLLRLLHMCQTSGSLALVMSQYWLFKSSYSDVRLQLLADLEWPILAKLGVGAFETVSGEVVNVMAGVWSNKRPAPTSTIVGLDVMAFSAAAEKAAALTKEAITRLRQSEQRSNANSRIIIGGVRDASTLETLAIAPQGAKTGDDDRWCKCMWEIRTRESSWVPYQSTVRTVCLYGGRHLYLDWRTGGIGMVRPRVGNLAVGRRGVAISQSGELPATLYTGERFDSNVAPLIPGDPKVIPALWAYCSAAEYVHSVREIDQSLKVTNVPLIQVPFDVAHWRKVAAEQYPDGLPKPYSSDPTQWLFNGHPKGSDQPLQVAVARLLGYRWPRQTGSSFPDCPALGPDGLERFADDDGIVCLPPIQREQPAAARLRALLEAALGRFDERALIAQTGSEAASLEDWLRDEFFEQHCDLFHDRPFIWHIWDGRKDGFHALVHYHRLDHETLKKLTYSYLGDWIRQQDEEAKADRPGAAERLGAAQSLQAELGRIIEGEAPYDLFVRWKPLLQQPIGWHPDLNDGVRFNIRPFMQAGDVKKKGAGLLRAKPNIKWDKDRGTEPERAKAEYPWFWCTEAPEQDSLGGRTFVGSRWNDAHFSLEKKRKAREGGRP